MDKRTELIAIADAKHTQYPQYKNYWDNWVLMVVTKKVKTKMGVAFDKGEVVLVKPQTEFHKVMPKENLPYDQWPEKEFRVAYSVKTGCNTQVDAKSFKEI
jgi:hypothetical protein